MAYDGQVSMEPMLDTIGPMAKTTLEVAQLLQAIAGSDWLDDRQLGAPTTLPDYVGAVLGGRKEGIKGIKIGVLKEGFERPSMASSYENVVRKAIAKLGLRGATVEDVSIPT